MTPPKYLWLKVEFFITVKKTLSAIFQFATDGCAQTKFESVWVAMQP